MIYEEGDQKDLDLSKETWRTIKSSDTIGKIHSGAVYIVKSSIGTEYLPISIIEVHVDYSTDHRFIKSAQEGVSTLELMN